MACKKRAGILVPLALACLWWNAAWGHEQTIRANTLYRRMRSAFPAGGTFEFSKHPDSPKAPIMEGHSVKMECETTAHSDIHWTINGERIVNAPRRHYTSSGWSSTLTITRASRVLDSGSISCSATSSAEQAIKSDEAVLDVTWLDNPVVELEQPDDTNQIKNGVNVQLECEADIGNGDVQYHWFRNSERVSSKMERIDVKKMKLRIENVNAKDNGIYRCSVHLNGEMKDSKSNFVINIEDESVPHISEPPSDQLLPPKASAFFHCQYKSADVVEWFKNDLNLPLESNERITIHKNGSLSIKNITKRDEGFYSCAAFRNDEKLQLQRFAARLKIAYIKPLTVMDFEPQIPENRVIAAQEGQPFSLVCLGSKDNNPISQIMWKNTHKHLISDSGEIRVDDGALIIDIVKKTHQGIYSCTSENTAGSQELSIFIVVNPMPKITKGPTKTSVKEKKSATLKCNVLIEKQKNLQSDLKAFWNKIITLSYLKSLNGKHHNSKKHNIEDQYSTVSGVESDNNATNHMTKEQLMTKWNEEFNWDLYEFRWMRDGKQMTDHEYNVMIMPKEGLLKFEHISSTNAGNYWCEVITSAGHSIKSQMALLTVLEKLRFSPPPVNKKLELNSSAKIHCKVQGSPTPIVSWFRDYNETLPDDVQSINGTLQFTDVSRGHKGNYTCTATNTEETIETFIFIDVVVSPRFISPLPTQVIDVTEGDPVWIDCIAEGDPEPKTQWDRNLDLINTISADNNKSDVTNGDAINKGNGINENERIHLLENGTLYIKSTRIEDGDRYGCTAGNSAGLKREEVTLVVHAIVVDVDENEDGVITKAILITMSVVGAYMILVIGLMVWCRVRRRRKITRNLANEKLENGDLEMKEEKDGPNDKLIENNDDIMNNDSDKYCQLKNAKNKCNGSGKQKNGMVGKTKGSNENCGNITGGESGQNMSDNSELSTNSKASRKGYSGINSRYDKIVMPRSLLYDIALLGRGEFGDILLGKCHNSKSNRNSRIEEVELLADEDGSIKSESKKSKYAMIKSLLHTKDENHLAEFKRQLDMFSKLKHENVSEIIGLCNDMEPHYLVFEYTDWGDFKQFLLATRNEEEIAALNEKSGKTEDSVSVKKTGNTTPLLVPQMLTLVHQISKGMEYISDNRMVHRDLATRNCLISSNFSVKISIPALTKDMYSKEYYKHVNQVIPLRWLPYECVYESDYTTKSDIYMFACTVWEIFFKAELPFIKMSDSTVLAQLKNNTLTWKMHDDMPKSLVELLENCWDISLKNRPTFTETTRRISKILKESTT